MKRIVIALILAALATSGAYALGLGRQGVGMGKLGASSKAGPAAIPPANCGTGVINLSTGCTQPMLGGL